MSVEENKRIAAKYHDLNPEDVDEILTEDFVGRHWNWTWDRERHREFLANHPEMVDTIHDQIGEGELVATRFTRTLELSGRSVRAEGTHFKRFRDGKIAEIWEHGDSKQFEEQA